MSVESRIAKCSRLPRRIKVNLLCHSRLYLEISILKTVKEFKKIGIAIGLYHLTMPKRLLITCNDTTLEFDQ